MYSIRLIINAIHVGPKGYGHDHSYIADKLVQELKQKGEGQRCRDQCARIIPSGVDTFSPSP
jgi:hypothetical protein